MILLIVDLGMLFIWQALEQKSYSSLIFQHFQALDDLVASENYIFEEGFEPVAFRFAAVSTEALFPVFSTSYLYLPK